MHTMFYNHSVISFGDIVKFVYLIDYWLIFLRLVIYLLFHEYTFQSDSFNAYVGL